MLNDDQTSAYIILGNYLSGLWMKDFDTSSYESLKKLSLENANKIIDKSLKDSLERIISAENIMLHPGGLSINNYSSN